MSRYRQPYCLYKRGKYWYYRTYTADGIRTVAKTTGKTSKGAAKQYLDALYLEGSLAHSSITFGQYAKHFFDDNSPYIKDRSKPLAKNSIRLHRTHLYDHIMPYMENVKVCDINYTQLKLFRMKMIEKFSSNYVISIMFTFRTIINSAYKDRIITVNPFDFLDGIEKEYNRLDAFTLPEIKAIYQEITDPMFKKMILLLALTGVRMSEGVGLVSEDVKQGDNFLYIDLKRQYCRNEYMPLKTKDSRKFPVIPEIQELINFQKGKVSGFYRAFEKIKTKYETEDRGRLTFHSFRHFFITNCIAKGIPESKVNYFTGHRQKGINQTYINFKPDDMLEFLTWQKELYDYVTG